MSLSVVRLFPLIIFLFCFFIGAAPALAQRTVRTPVADGFDLPVGPPDAKGYYMARGFRASSHLGEDWNGVGGGNSDLGDPIYNIGHGVVVFARDVRLGWGNVVIIRHAYRDGGKVKLIDSLYGHLQRVDVKEGQRVQRGQKIGTMGNNRGMYSAHLHFEIRHNLKVGMTRTAYPRDLTAYHRPTPWIKERRQLRGGGSASIPVDTFTDTRTFGAPTNEARLGYTRETPRGPGRARR
ncbi:MAG: murein hydrolase activator EnvC family protein [Verrucomicrobiales bacterium]